MEYIKDKFKISDILAAEISIKNRLKDFVKSRNLTVIKNSYSSNINLVAVKPASTGYSEFINNFDKFIDNDFSIFTEPDKKPTHTITTHLLKEFYDDVYLKLTDEEQQIYLKTISNHQENNQVANFVSTNLPNEQFFKHLRYISPFGKGSKQGWIFKIYQRALNTKSIDKEDKVQSLFQFYHYYKPIVRRTDTISSIVRYVDSSVPKEWHTELSKLLGMEIENLSKCKDYLETDKSSIIIKLDKSKLFQQLPLNHFPQAEVSTYNSMINSIVKSLGTVLKDRTGIEHIYIEELSSQSKPCRIYIESSGSEFKCNIKELFMELMDISACQFKSNNRNEMSKIHEDTYNYYIINKSLNSNDELEKNKPIKRIKI